MPDIALRRNLMSLAQERRANWKRGCHMHRMISHDLSCPFVSYNFATLNY
jgi:hypothetical protein